MANCRLCNRPITMPSYIAVGRRVCPSCRRKQSKVARRKRWAAGERPACQFHPDRWVNAAYWTNTGKRRCRSCVNLIPAHARDYDKRSRARKQNPEKQAIRRISHRALRDGVIVAQPCVFCGKPAEMHHPDYNEPLKVSWLCGDHHRLIHRANNIDGRGPIPAKETK